MRPVLSTRALNRALLQRQGLLERTRGSALDTIEWLVGMQAQVPENPYVALWLRLADFEPSELSELISERRAVRAGLLRATIHLVSLRDYRVLRALTAPHLAKIFTSPFTAGLAGVPVDDVAAAGAELLHERPRTRAELGDLLAPRWPQADPSSLAYAVTLHVPLVQVPPRGLWRATGQATWALAEDWLGEPVDPAPSIDGVIVRYLAAFGPATPGDARTWSRITGLREVFERLRPRLRTFRDENGRELFDVPDGPLPDPDTPAPPRFLPEYDNVTLSHDDRSRIVAARREGEAIPRGTTIGTLLVDGFVRADWRLVAADGAVSVTIDGFAPAPHDPPGTREEIETEADGLMRFLVPERRSGDWSSSGP